MKSRQTISLITICGLLLVGNLRAQFWAQDLGGNEVDEVMDMTRDGAGNLYSAGYFTNQVTFGTSINYSSASWGIPDIFIQKSNASGVVQWATVAGGIGSDRALAIAIDASGNCYITGFYFGQATFGSITLSAVNGGKDCFIAKLNSSGTFVWAVSCGGTMTDIGNSISVDPSGNVFVGGQFEGTATFGSASYTSMTNPNTSLPSIDIFISKLDNNGNFLWTKHGAAEYTDRALDILCDNSGNAYVCGQFSDTIQFANTYNNPVMNAIWLMKVDGAGNETWFRRASGTFSIAYSLALDASQNLYMTGDYQGQLAFYGTPTNFLSDNYSDRVFLVKYSSSGNFIWASSSSSNSYISSRVVAVDPNNDPYILGEFGCTLNDYADVYGQGTFNNIGYKDIFVTKFNSSGTWQWARNFGGPGTDLAHGMVVKTVDRPTIAGSFEKHITWPASGLTPPWFTVTSQPATEYTGGTSINPAGYCNDPYYGAFTGLDAQGFSDGFIADIVDLTRQPYDYYARINPSGCSKPFLPGCIDLGWTTYNCPDTISFCGLGNINANTWTADDYNFGYGPAYHYQWSTAANDTFPWNSVNTSGYYAVTMTTFDGCYTSSDSVYVQINPYPPYPTISDDVVVNTNHPPFALPITICADSAWLWGGNYSPTDTISWHLDFPPSQFLTNNDSIQVWTSGQYTFEVTNVFGCTRWNYVQVNIDSLNSPWVVKSLIPDTIVRCYGQLVPLLFYDTISNPNGNPNYVLHDFLQSMITVPSANVIENSQPGTLGGGFTAITSGTYIVVDTIWQTNTCTTYVHIVRDTFYLLVNPNPAISLSTTATQYLCPGDTAMYIVTATPSTTLNTSWTISPNDTVIVWQPGSTCWYSVITDTITGCWGQDMSCTNIQYKPSPVLTTIPASGIICPNDSAMIHCSNGTAVTYQWIGPNGILPWNTQDIWDSVPGFYHCIITDVDGCELTSNTVELKQYNTPYLVANPGNVVCLNQSIVLQVITNDTTLIQWQAPLSGSGTQQVVTQTGTYTCYVTMCGITTLCSIQVVVSQITATISGLSTLCPGDSTWLVANPGASGYSWSPVQSFTDSVFVTAGSYTLTTTDVNGCTATATINVAIDSSVVPPAVSGDTVCLGNNAIVYANAQGPIDWYDLPAGGNLLGSGNSLSVNNVQGDSTVYVWTQDTSGCHSVMTPVDIYVDITSVPPVITSGDTLCVGDTMYLCVNVVPNAQYIWSGPQNYYSNNPCEYVPGIDTSDSGVYSVFINGPNCISDSSHINIVVLPSTLPLVSWSDSICEGATVSPYVINYDSSAVYNWSGPNNFSASGSPVSIGPASMNMSGVYTVAMSGFCSSGNQNYNLTVLPAPGAFTAGVNSPVCPGDTIFFTASNSSGAVSYEWYGLFNSYYSNQQNPTAIADSSMTGMYTVIAHSANGCMSLQPQSVNVVVLPEPQVSIGPDTIVCMVPVYIVNASGNYPSYVWHDNTPGQQYPAQQTGLYTVMVTDSNGCHGYDSAYIEVIRCGPQAMNIFTPNNDGQNDYFALGGEHYQELHCVIFNRWGVKVYELNDPLQSWDGTYMQNNKPVEEGVYYYIGNVKTYDGQLVEVTGFIQLNR